MRLSFKFVSHHERGASMKRDDLNDLAAFTGHDVNELKGYIKGTMGIKHTADMDKMPFVDLIERTYQLGAELGFNWPEEKNEP